ncbi:MAG: hypothetical protein JJU11_05950 [Candidatus Sumerlaeia bacterium]|nr:hypothetical protein [Candidatus Sumerlaeia bacterium]
MGNFFDQLQRSIGLIRAYHPNWEVLQLDPGETTSLATREILAGRGANFRPLMTLSPMPGAGVLRLTTAMPITALATKTAGLGRPDPSLPITFWPLHLAVAVGFRLRNFGWPVTFNWPSGILIEDCSIAVFHCEKVGEWLVMDAAISLAPDLGLPREECLVVPFRKNLASHGTGDVSEVSCPMAILPTLLHGIIGCLESPWPKKLAMEFYTRHCSQIDQFDGVFHGGGMLVKGIARSIDDAGSMVVEGNGGAMVTVPCYIPFLGGSPGFPPTSSH